MDFKTLKSSMLQEAECNPGLFRALGYSQNIADLRDCIHQAHGVGSERFKKAFAYVLKRCRDSTNCPL